MINNSINTSDVTSNGGPLLYHLKSKVWIAILWSVLSILGIIGNGLVIYIAISYKKLNDYTNRYIFNLAITDLLFVIFCIPFTTFIFVSESWPFGVIPCKISHFISHVSVQSTCLTLCAMTIHRCHTIIHNKTLKQNLVTYKKKGKSIVKITIIIWIVSILISFPDLYFYSVTNKIAFDGEKMGLCTLKFDSHLSVIYIKIGRPFTILTSYVIPLIVIVCSYTKLLSYLMLKSKITNGKPKVKKSNHSTQSSRTAEETISTLSNKRYRIQKNIKRKKTRKVTKLVSVVTLNFAICWLPANFFIILIVFVDKLDNGFIKHHLYLFKLFAHTLSYLTPVLNPISYAFYNDKFRGPLKHLWNRIFNNGSQRYRPDIETNCITHHSKTETAL